MTPTERRWVEDKIADLVANLTRGEQALVYKTLYATGLRIVDCNDLIAKAFAAIGGQERPQEMRQRPVSPAKGWSPQMP